MTTQASEASSWPRLAIVGMLSLVPCFKKSLAATQNGDQQQGSQEERLQQAEEKLEDLDEKLTNSGVELLDSFFQGGINQAKRRIELIRQAKKDFPATRGFLRASHPMSTGDFKEAGKRLEAYLKANPNDLLAAFCYALCQLELREFKSANDTLHKWFRQDGKHPTVRFLKRFSGRLAETLKPTDEDIVYAFDWAHATVRSEIETAHPAWYSSDPTIDDPLPFRFWALGEESSGPLTITDEVATRISSMRVSFSPLDRAMLAAVMDLEDMAVPPAAQEMFEILTKWYGENKLYEQDTPDRLEALHDLQKLQPTNEAWKLLEITYDEGVYHEGNEEKPDYYSYRVLSNEEMKTLREAFASEDLDLVLQEWPNSIRSLLASGGFPYGRSIRPEWPFNIYPHVLSISHRMDFACVQLIEKGDHKKALQLAELLVKLGEEMWRQSNWNQPVARLSGTHVSQRGYHVLAKLADGDPQQGSSYLRQSMESSLSMAVENESTLCIELLAALPLTLLDHAWYTSFNIAQLMRRAEIRIRNSAGDVAEMADENNWRYFPHSHLLHKAIIIGNEVVVPLIVEHIDNYLRDPGETFPYFKLQAIWALGKLRDKRAKPKLEELSKADDPIVAEMAKWALAELGGV